MSNQPFPTDELSYEAIEYYVRRGRRLHDEAVRDAFVRLLSALRGLRLLPPAAPADRRPC